MGNFKDLKAWRHARTLVVLTKPAIARLPSAERCALADQWRRAGTLVTVNRLRLTACGLRLLGPRLLLCQTVDCPEPPHQIHRMDPHDRPVANELGEDPERHAVAGIVERGHEHGAVRDVEIRVARGKT